MTDTTPQKERNSFIVDLFSGGKKTNEIKDLLIKAGYPPISVNRIWKIWKTSKDYEPKRAKERFCTFCLENKIQLEMKSIIEKYKIVGKICNSCWDRLRPEQPVKQDEQRDNQNPVS